MTDSTFAELRKEMLGFANHMLERHGEFLPFCMVRTADGDIAPFAVQGDDPNPDAVTLIGWHGEELAKLAAQGSITQSAMAVDIRMRDPAGGDPVDAVMLTFREAGSAQDEAVPYSVETSGRLFKKRSIPFGEGRVSQPERNEIFG